MAKLYVVCGHGAGDPGAGGYGFTEAERVRALAWEMQQQAGDQIIIGDASVNWFASNRFSTMTNPGCPVLELHMDAASASACGGHVIYDADLAPDDQDRALAAYISSVFPGRSNTLVARNNLKNVNVCARRGINYRLMECCFITNYNDLQRFNENLSAIASGILGVFGVSTQAAQPVAPEPPASDPKEYPPAPVVASTVARVVNPSTGMHVWTASDAEVAELVAAGWTLEGDAFGCVPTISVLRLMNPYSGDHFFTASHDEACAMVDAGWHYEGVAFTAPESGTEVIRYVRDDGAHMWSADTDEQAALERDGWTREGVAWYA